MNADQERMRPESERLLRAWLDARDPGAAPATLVSAVAGVPDTTRPAFFPALGETLARVLGPGTLLRPIVALLLLVVAIVVAAVGAAILTRPTPSAPRGLIAYTVALGQGTGSTGIRLVAADGTGSQDVTSVSENLLEHSPRWSPDGNSLLFARVTNLDPNLSFCAGVGSIVLYDIAKAEERVVASNLGPVGLVEWAPAGDQVAFTQPSAGCFDDGNLGVLDLASGHITYSHLEGAVRRGLRWVAGAPSVWSELDRGPCKPAGEVNRSCQTWVPSYDGRLEAEAGGDLRDVSHRLVISDLKTGGKTDLGSGVGAFWSPDSTAIAFLQPVDLAVPRKGEPLRPQLARLAIATVDTWQVRFLDDVIVEIGSTEYDAPTLHWTADGTAIYWKDIFGGHVLNVTGGSDIGLPSVVNGSTDMQWQPTP